MAEAPRVVTLVGLGMMGASLGLALADAGVRRLGVAGPDPQDGQALDAGAVDELVSFEEGVAAADVVVLCAPVRAIERLVPRAATHMRAGAVLTDIGSVKGAIVAAMDAVEATSIGGHPMCGSEQSGAAFADAGRFAGATWVLSPGQRTTPAATAAGEWLARAAGAEPVVIGAARHDELVALASHLPYAVAQALVHLLAADAGSRTVGASARDLAAGGMRDATRVAAGSVEMWRDILAGNSTNVRAAIRTLCSELESLDALLDDPIGIDAWLREGQQVRQSLDV